MNVHKIEIIKKPIFFQKHEKWESKRSILHDNQRKGHKKKPLFLPLIIRRPFKFLFSTQLLFFVSRIMGIIENKYLEHVCLGHKFLFSKTNVFPIENSKRFS